MNLTRPALLAATIVTALATPAAGQVPEAMTFTARLVDDGTPHEGVVDLSFDLYRAPSGGTSVWSETTTATASLGLVAVRLGETVPLDAAVIDGSDLYLQLIVEGQVLSPRLAIGSVPYAAMAARAAYAEECGSVPTGSVMYFNLASCPAGWSPLDAARGRAIVGTPAAGTGGGTVGTALGDLENRVHAHGVGPFTATTNAAGGHTHTVNPVTVNTSAVNLAHTHDVNPALFTTASGGSHNHAWAQWAQNTLIWTTWLSDGITPLEMVDYTNGFTNSGSGSYPVEYSAGTGATMYTADSTHSHSIDVPATTSGGSSISMNHDHQVNIPQTTSTAVADHSHGVTIAAATSASATTGAVMPYLQLLTCRKD